MAVVSLSLPRKMLDELDGLVKRKGYKGRSDAVRAALKTLASENRQQESTRGKVSGIMLLIHDEKDESAFSQARHSFEGLIKTLIHNQLDNDKCLEVFILEGEADDVRELEKSCRVSGKAEYLKTIMA